MGAAASIQKVYTDAIDWFKRYFDEGVYYHDFETIDKDADGCITYRELQHWIKNKATNAGENSGWALLLTHPDILKIAHQQAGRYDSNILSSSNRVVNAMQFRFLLIHLFAISTIWVHFKNADDWLDGGDFGNLKLNMAEFKLACKTLCAAHANEELEEAKIEEAFHLLDKNHDNQLAFMEVCHYCCRFIDKNFNGDISLEYNPVDVTFQGNSQPNENQVSNTEQGSTATDNENPILKKVSPRMTINETTGCVILGEDVEQIIDDYVEDLEEEESRKESSETNTLALKPSKFLQFHANQIDPTASAYAISTDYKGHNSSSSSLKPTIKFRTMESKNKIAVDALVEHISHNKNVAEFVEVKVMTENQLKDIIQG